MAMCIMDLSTCKVEEITNFGSSPCWSPDGKWIVFQGFGALYKINVETKKLKLIVGRPCQSYKCPQYYYPDWR